MSEKDSSPSLWGDAGYGAAYSLLCDLQNRMRYVANKWEGVTDGDCSFGGTAHMIRIVLDAYADGTVFHTEEVQEWIDQFERLHKRAKKRLPKRIPLSAYYESVMSDLSVILANSTDVESREEWEVERDLRIKEVEAQLDWVKSFRKKHS